MSELSRPFEIRALLRDDPARVRDPQLLTLLLRQGSTRRASEQLPKKIWTPVALGEDLYAAAGWRLTTLVYQGLAGGIDLRLFGLGPILGGRLIAALALARRWHRGWRDGGNIEIRVETLREMSKAALRLPSQATDGELIALLLGAGPPAAEEARGLLAAFGSLSELIATLTLDHFDPPTPSRSRYRLQGTSVKLWPDACFSLVAALELARRYQLEAATASPSEPAEALEMGAEDRLLLSLLDPTRPLDDEQRSGLIEVLRTHPRLADELARLEDLAGDQGTQDGRKAAQLHRMFEALCATREWSHPSEVLGSRVPYADLLVIAEARIGEARNCREPEPQARLLKIRHLLEMAEQQAAAPPVAACLEALQELGISARAVEMTLVSALRRDLAGKGPDANTSAG